MQTYFFCDLKKKIISILSLSIWDEAEILPLDQQFRRGFMNSKECFLRFTNTKFYRTPDSELWWNLIPSSL